MKNQTDTKLFVGTNRCLHVCFSFSELIGSNVLGVPSSIIFVLY